MRSGTPNHPITYRSAGDGPVTISGADVIAGWHGSDSGVYLASMKIDLGPRCNQVFVDGREMVEARWPHVPWDAKSGFDLLSAPFARASTTKSSSTITMLDAMQPDNFWRGAMMWSEIGDRWTAQTASVVSSAPGELTINDKSKPWFPDDSPLFGDDGFAYITGTAAALSAPGEWFYSNGEVRLITVDRSDPNTHRVEVRSGRRVADLSGRDWITLDGLAGFAGNAVIDGAHCSLHDCDFRYVTHDAAAAYASHGGIDLSGHDNVLDGCIVDTSTSNGVILNGHDNTVTGCVIANVDSNGDYSAAVVMGGRHNTLEHCTLTRSGRALVIPAGTSDVIRYNDMSHAMLLTQDGGAFYTWKIESQGTSIDHNWVHDVVPPPGSQGPYDGIYLDDGCTHFLVHHNVVWNCKAGIRLGHIYAINGDRVYQNTLWGNLKTMNQHGDEPMTDIQTFNNLSDRGDYIGTNVRANVTTADPKFVNVGAHDFRLQSGSQLKGVGAYEVGDMWAAGAEKAMSRWKSAAK